MKNKPTYYEYFDLPNFEPDQDKIKRAYRSMALKKHPDRGGSTEAMKTVNEVYRVLSKHKDEYDIYLRKKLNGDRSSVSFSDDIDEFLRAYRKSKIYSGSSSTLFDFKMPY